MLSRVFSLDVVDEIVMKSPCDSIEHATWQKKLQDPFTLEEVNRILDSMREHYPEPVPNFYEFTFLTGLRTSEGIGLEWTKVDWAAQTVQIEQGFPVNEIEDTKTSKVNTVNLNSGALPALQRQKAWTYLNEDPCVCLDPGTGKPWAYEQNARKRY